MASRYSSDITQQALACVERAIALQGDSEEARALKVEIVACIGEEK
jgi:hypothetical protein